MANAIVSQSGGPTGVINASLVGVIEEANTHKEIDNLYGAVHAVAGIVKEDFIDLKKLSLEELEGVAGSPSAALGSSRDKPDEAYCEKVLDVFKKNDIRYFYYIGGNDSANTCHIINDADPVDVVIEKLWVVDGMGGDEIHQSYTLTLYCDAEIELRVSSCGDSNNRGYPGYKSCQVFKGQGSDTFTAQVRPEYPGSSCWVVESYIDDAVEVQNDCGPGKLEISAGNGASCLITNTVFFEGIPTLSQYGLALLALLMLSVGMVGFRRYS